MVTTLGELRTMSAVEIAAAVKAGDASPVEIVEAHVVALDEALALNAIVTDSAEQALTRAQTGVSGPLAGVTLLVKDLFDTAGITTTYGSAIFREHVPSRTATAVQRLESAGAVVIGKANLHEFAWGTTSQNPFYGFVGNPSLPGRVSGGSSGGNAASLAAGVSVLGLGTDTAGSVRIPSACCGTVGFKPAHDVVTMRGCRPLSPTYDVAGPMTRTVADCALAYTVLSGRPRPQPRLEGLVVGLLERTPRMSPHEPGAPPGTETPVPLDEWTRLIESLGARVVDASLPEPEADLIPILLYEAAVEHRETFPSRRDEYGADTQLKWDVARKVPAIDVYEAQQELPRWREAARSTTTDVYLTPVLSVEVPPIDVWEPDVRVSLVSNTRTFSFLNWPAIAIGNLQLAGPDDQVVLGAALALEQAGFVPEPAGSSS